MALRKILFKNILVIIISWPSKLADIQERYTCRTRCWKFSRNRFGRVGENDNLMPFNRAFCSLSGVMFQPYTIATIAMRSRNVYVSKLVFFVRLCTIRDCVVFWDVLNSTQQWWLWHEAWLNPIQVPSQESMRTLGGHSAVHFRVNWNSIWTLKTFLALVLSVNICKT